MNIQIPKDIDEKEAKLYKGLSLRQFFSLMGTIGIIFVICGVGKAPIEAGIIPGAIFFISTFKNINHVPVPVFVYRFLVGKTVNESYTRESMGRIHYQTEKDQIKSAKAWNRELARQKEKGRKQIKTVRCMKGNKTRK